MEFLLTANHSTQFVAKELARDWPEAQVKEADYDSIVPTLLSAPTAQHIWILLDSQNLRNQFQSLTPESREGFGENWLDPIRKGSELAKQNQTQVWLALPPMILAATTHAVLRPDQFEFHLFSIREGLMDLVTQEAHVSMIDLQSLISRQGLDAAYDPKLRTLADQPYSLKFTRSLAQEMTRVHRLAMGKVQKCCILDLDHTLWGGVIGDDGVEGIAIGRDGLGKVYREIQLWARELRRRGIILAVCSKNTESIAREPFQRHPEMILREEDIAVFVANWEDKASNIRHIQEVLNIGFDSMVFIDDNPMERAIVREQLPEVTVPDLPEAPEEYLPYLESLHLFDTLSKASLDGMDRTRQYQVEAERVKERKASGNLNEFLANLEMTSTISSPFQTADFPRISELFQRSNQFNLTTIRYSESDVRHLTEAEDHLTFSFRLQDKFGEHGIISLVVAEIQPPELVIQAWVMSCRVLKRTMEHFVMNTLVDAARSAGCNRIVGRYIQTPKNALVADLYPQLGFTPRDEDFVLTLSPRTPFSSHISPS